MRNSMSVSVVRLDASSAMLLSSPAGSLSKGGSGGTVGGEPAGEVGWQPGRWL